MAASCYRKLGAYAEAIAKHKEIPALHPSNMECLKYLVNAAPCSSVGRSNEDKVYEARLERRNIIELH
jgi:hypothetical protein